MAIRGSCPKLLPEKKSSSSYGLQKLIRRALKEGMNEFKTVYLES